MILPILIGNIVQIDPTEIQGEKMKQENITAVEVPDGEWFMVIRTNTWYKKIGGGVDFVQGEQIPSGTTSLVANEEEVIQG